MTLKTELRDLRDKFFWERPYQRIAMIEMLIDLRKPNVPDYWLGMTCCERNR